MQLDFLQAFAICHSTKLPKVFFLIMIDPERQRAPTVCHRGALPQKGGFQRIGTYRAAGESVSLFWLNMKLTCTGEKPTSFLKMRRTWCHAASSLRWERTGARWAAVRPSECLYANYGSQTGIRHHPTHSAPFIPVLLTRFLAYLDRRGASRWLRERDSPILISDFLQM